MRRTPDLLQEDGDSYLIRRYGCGASGYLNGDGDAGVVMRLESHGKQLYFYYQDLYYEQSPKLRRT